MSILAVMVCLATTVKTMLTNSGRNTSGYSVREINVGSPLWLWSLFLTILVGCDSSMEVNLSGRLIYTAGAQTIRMLNLISRQSSLLYESSSHGTLIEHLTKTSADQLLFDECPATQPCVIKELTVSTGETRTWRPGVMPTYIAGHDIVFFYEASGYQANNALWATRKSDPLNAYRVANAPTPKTLPNGLSLRLTTPVVQTSSDEVVFVGEDYQLWVYRITQAVSVPTAIDNCLPQAWRNSTEQLLCYDWDSWNLYLVNLKTKQKELLPSLQGAHGLLFLPEGDVVIYGKRRSYWLVAETADLFAYSFRTKETVKLHSHTGMHSGVWLADQG